MDPAYHGQQESQSGASLSLGEKLWTQRIELMKCARPLGVQMTVAGCHKSDPKFYTGKLWFCFDL